MIASVFYGPGEIEVEDVPLPEIGPDEVLVRVGANTLCGTDLRILRGEKTRGIHPPSILGHEFAGHVSDVGREVRGFEEGMPVAVAPMIPCLRCYYCKNGLENLCSDERLIGYDVDGGLGEYVRVPSVAVEAGNLFVVGEDLPPEHLALTEPLSCCVNGQRRSRVSLDDTVLIMGAGPIGLFHLQLSLLAGARTVIVSEPSPTRRAFASDLGAHLAVDPNTGDLRAAVEESTGGLGVDSAVICIGLPHLVNGALSLTRKGGRVNVFAGLADKGWAEVEANLIHYNELEVTGTSNSRRSDFETALRLIESGSIDVGSMITDRVPLGSANEAFDRAAAGEGLKVAVMP